MVNKNFREVDSIISKLLWMLCYKCVAKASLNFQFIDPMICPLQQCWGHSELSNHHHNLRFFTERQREQSFHWFTPQMAPNDQHWIRPKPRARKQMLLSSFYAGRRGPSTWNTFFCFPRYISRELEQKWSSQDMNQHTYRMPVRVMT